MLFYTVLALCFKNMDLKEIVNRPDNYAITQEEVLFVIKEYIKIRKNVDVNPTIDVRSGNMKAIMELQMMIEMATYAVGWLRGKLN